MVELQTGQGVDGRAGGDQDVIRFELLLAVFGLYLYLLGFDEAAYSVVDGDLVLLHQALHAAPELVDDLFAALGGLRVVELYLADLDPEVFAVSGVVQEMGRLKQCFGRDAAYVQACASEMPPSRFSMRATLIPSWLARIAGMYPPFPPPITTRSKLSATCSLPSFQVSGVRFQVCSC